MILGIMQPYFFPYLGYFDLINYSDKWIVFDTVQYIRHGWINRNRILHPNKGWQYIMTPLKKHNRDIKIKDLEITDDNKWKDKIMGQLNHYRKKAPYFNETTNIVSDCLSEKERSVSRLNVFILDKVCARLGIHFDYDFFSEMDLDLEPVEDPGDWALRISEALGAKEYVNPPGGADLFDEQKFRNSNIKLKIRDIPPLEYSCTGYEFVPGLSIVDVLMWNEPEKIKGYLNKYN